VNSITVVSGKWCCVFAVELKKNGKITQYFIVLCGVLNDKDRHNQRHVREIN